MELTRTDTAVRKALGRIAFLLTRMEEDEPILSKGSTKPKEIGVCDTCYSPVTDNSPHYKIAQGNLYHETCFKCAHCDSKISSVCYFNEGELYCQKDYNKLFKTVCDAKTCRKPIESEAIETEAGVFHEKCFNCNACQIPLGERIEGEFESNFMIRHDKIYCIEHALELDGRVCFVCESIILDDKAYETINRFGELLDLHVDCFKCAECDLKIEDQDVISYEIKDKEIFCARHGGMICAMCDRAISSRESYKLLMNEKYHTLCTPSCFRCNEVLSDGCQKTKSGWLCVSCMQGVKKDKIDLYV